MLSQTPNKQVDLSAYSNKNYNPGPLLKRIVWYILGEGLFNSMIPGSQWRILLLKIFGAQVGKNIVIKPYVKIKYPWKLKIGNNTWIGEKVWIDNLASVNIGNNVCLSQGAMLLCGNHNYKKTSFDLITRSIIIEDGAWIGAKSVIGPGIIVKTHTVITIGSIVIQNTEPYTIYRGNPAIKIRERKITD